MQPIFDGNEIAVFVDRASATAEVAVFSFSGYGDHVHENPRYADGFLQKIGVIGVFFVAKQNHWWQSPEMKAALEAANSAVIGIKRRVTYGQSMGGFGAAAFAVELGADYLITAPQLSLLTSRAKLHQEWLNSIAGRPLLYPDAAQRLSGASGIMIYDSLHPIDTTHADLLNGIPGRHQRLIVPMASHFVPRTLAETGYFSKLIADLIINQHPDLAYHRRRIRQERIKSGRYVEMLMHKTASRKGPLLWKLAEGAITRFLRETKPGAGKCPKHFEFLITSQDQRWGRRVSQFVLPNELALQLHQ